MVAPSFGNESMGGISKRITIGWGPKQHDDYKKTMYHHKKKLPYPKFPLPGMEPEYKIEPDYLKQLSDIMSLSQKVLDKLYEHPFDNEYRYNLFGKKLGEYFHSTCLSRFEFVDIFVEQDCNLNRHLDYKNDWREAYTFGGSYSYLIQRKEDGLIYRVNFIMCSRHVCGAFMEELNVV